MSSSESKTGNNLPLFFIGVALILAGAFIFILTFFPVVKEEVGYMAGAKSNSAYIKPVNKDFAIVIPKIGANAPVIANVDPFDPSRYQIALSKGVAHAAGTAFPGHAGNTFIFAHSSADWYTANRYNSVFYLLHRLEKKDKIEVYYRNKKFIYEVIKKQLADPSDLSFLKASASSDSTLTLMTCWPPGTAFKRLILTGRLQVSP